MPVRKPGPLPIRGGVYLAELAVTERGDTALIKATVGRKPPVTAAKVVGVGIKGMAPAMPQPRAAKASSPARGAASPAARPAAKSASKRRRSRS